MKAKIERFEKGFAGDGHTPYRLQLMPENEEEKSLMNELWGYYIVWVSPNKRDKDGAVSWWGKK